MFSKSAPVLPTGSTLAREAGLPAGCPSSHSSRSCSHSRNSLSVPITRGTLTLSPSEPQKRRKALIQILFYWIEHSYKEDFSRSAFFSGSVSTDRYFLFQQPLPCTKPTDIAKTLPKWGGNKVNNFFTSQEFCSVILTLTTITK